MGEAPERIWLDQTMSGWVALDFKPRWMDLPEYARADLLTAAEAEIARLRDRVAKLEAAMNSGTPGWYAGNVMMEPKS